MGDLSPERRKRLMAEATENASGNGDFYSLKNLTNDVIRLTPIGDAFIARKRVVYFLNKKPFICNEETHKKPGVIAKAIRALTELGDSDALEMANSIKGERRTKYAMKIIQRSNPSKVMWLEAPGSIYQFIFGCFNDDGEDISDKKEGRDIRISKKGSGLDTEYSCRTMDKSPLAPTKEDRMAIRAAADAMDVETILRADEDGAVDALKGIIPSKLWKLIAKEVVGDNAADEGDGDADAGDDDQDDEDEVPAAKSKPKAKVVDEDEDEDAPKAKSKAKVDDDEDEDEDVPAKASAPKSRTVDDDDDEPPARTSKAAAASKDDDEDEDAPAPKAAKGKAAAVVLEDEDEDEQPVSTKKKHQVDDDDDE